MNGLSDDVSLIGDDIRIIETNINVLLNVCKARAEESTKVRITQNKGKESENSYQKLERSQ